MTSRKIAVLEVNGTISDNGGASGLFSSEGYNHRSFLQMLEKAKDDSAVKGIVLRVNSPGGGVYESAEIRISALSYTPPPGELTRRTMPFTAESSFAFSSICKNDLWL